jgi:hypothetical protein
MLTTQDFTKLPEGLVVPLEGSVERCPRCGRNGIEEGQSAGAPFFVHVQTCEVLGDGMLTQPQDCCMLREIAAN